MELQLNQKLVEIFHGTRVCETRVTQQTRVLQTVVLGYFGTICN